MQCNLFKMPHAGSRAQRAPMQRRAIYVGLPLSVNNAARSGVPQISRKARKYEPPGGGVLENAGQYIPVNPFGIPANDFPGSQKIGN